MLREILHLIHRSTKLGRSTSVHMCKRTVTTCLYPLSARPRFMRSFASAEGSREWSTYENGNKTFATEVVESCETVVIKCRCCTHAAALSRLGYILDLCVSDSLDKQFRTVSTMLLLELQSSTTSTQMTSAMHSVQALSSMGSQ